MIDRIRLIFKIEGRDECFEDFIDDGQEAFYMGANIFTYSIFFDDTDEEIDFEVITRKYNLIKRKLTIIAKQMKG